MSLGQTIQVITSGTTDNQIGQSHKDRDPKKILEVIRFKLIKVIAGFNPFCVINPIRFKIAKSNIVHIHSPLYIISLQALIWSKLTRKKVVIHIHGGLGKPPVNISSRLVYLKLLFDRTIIKFQLSAADRIVTVSEEDERYIKEYLKINNKKITVINNAIDTNQFRKLKHDFDHSKSDDGRFRILYIGDLEKWKAVDQIFIALSMLSPKTLRNVEVLIIGEGSQLQNLKLIGQNLNLNVSFLGGIKHSEVPKYLFTANLFVHTGLWEGMPTTILEAAAASLPVIASRSGQTKNLIKSKLNGLLYPPGNVGALASQIEFGINNPDEMRKYAENLKLDIEESHSMKKIAFEILKMYRN